MTQHAEVHGPVAAAKYGRVLTAAAVATPILIWATGLWLFHSHPGIFMAVTAEDGLVESAQLALVSLGAALAAIVALLLIRAGAHGWAIAYVAASVVLVVIAGEEMSWGQRVAGFATPRWFATHNARGEMTLHNLPHVMGVVVALVSAGVFLGIVGGNALWRRAPEEQASWRLYLWAPQPALTVGSLSLVGFVVYSTVLLRTSNVPSGAMQRLQELAELVLIITALYFLVAAVRGARALGAVRHPSSPLLYSTGLKVMEERAGPGPGTRAVSPESRRPLVIVIALTALAGITGWTLNSLPVPARAVAATPVAQGAPQQRSGWTLATRAGSEAALQDGSVDGELRVEISRVANNDPGDIQLARRGLAIEGGRAYRLEFQARSTSTRNAFVAVTQDHPPWGGLGLYQRLDLTGAWTRFRFDFVGKESDSNARISFDLGGGSTVDIGDVTMRRGPTWEPVPLEIRGNR